MFFVGQRRLQLLRTLSDKSETDNYLGVTLYPVLRKLVWTMPFRRLIYEHQLVPDLLVSLMKHIEDTCTAIIATHLLFELLASNNIAGEKYAFVEQFIDCDGPDKIIKALVYYW